MPFRETTADRATAWLRATSLATASIIALGGTPLPASVPTPNALAKPRERTLLRIERADATAETVRSSDTQTVEVLLSDGGSIVLAPGSQLIIDQYSYAAGTGAGALRLSLVEGSIRIIVGALGRTTPALLRAGGAELTLASGGSFILLENGQLRTSLLLGGPLTIQSGGRTQTLRRAGFEVVVATGGVPAAPHRQAPDQAFADASRINPGLSFGGAVTVRTGKDAEDTLASRSNSGANDQGNLVRTQLASVDVPSQPTSPPASPPPAASPPATSPPAVSPPTVSPPASPPAVSPPPVSPPASPPTASPPVSPSPPPPPPPPPPPISFVDYSGFVGDGSEIALGVPAGVITASNGNGDTSDGDPDITFTQLYDVSNGRPRSPGIVTNRVLRGSLFDYSLVGGSAYLKDPATGSSDLFVGRSNGLTNSIPEGDDFAFVDLDILEIEEDRLSFKGTPTEIFIREGVSNIFVSNVQPSRTLLVNSGDTLEVLIPTRSRPLPFTFIGGEVSVFDESSQVRNAAIVVPESFFGESGTVQSSSLSRQIPIDIFGSDKSGFVAFSSYDEYASENGAFDAFFADALTLSSEDFSSRNLAGSIDLSFRTLRSIAGNEFFQFVQVGDYDNNLIVHAAGDVSDARSGEFSIDRFTLTRGLLSADLVSGQLPGLVSQLAFRAFLPDSATPVGLGVSKVAVTPLIVVNPLDRTEPRDFASRVLNFDLGISVDGKLTTASATLGTLTYESSALPNPPFDDVFDTDTPDVEGSPEAVPRSLVTVKGQTIGASSAPDAGSTLFESPLVATAVGGGRVWTGGTSTLRPGYAGYFVLENANQIDSDNLADTGNAAAGGRVAPFGKSASAADTTQDYGLLRLATGISTNTTREGPTVVTTLRGYTAGAIATETSATENVIAPYLGTLELKLDPVVNGVTAAVTYRAPLGGDKFSPEQTVRFGELDGASAYVDSATFAASVRSANGAKAALVSGEPVKTGIAATVDPATGRSAIRSYSHVQWGFFFGDMLPQVTGRSYTPLSTWVAGARYAGDNTRIGLDDAMRASVSYDGHAIGTVLTQAGTSPVEAATKVGSFTQTWNLNSRTGTMDLNFDTQRFTAIPLAVAGSTGLAYNGLSDRVENRQARIAGELVDVISPTATPGGTIGTFQIRGVEGAYQANGTFAGDRRQ